MFKPNQTKPKANSAMRLLTIAWTLTAALSLWSAWKTYDSYQLTKLTANQTLKFEHSRGTIIHLDEVLTMSARMAAVTGDLQWEQRYRRFEPELDAAIKEAIKLAPGAYSSEAAAKTYAANIKLVQMENRAFELVGQGKTNKARAILFSDQYKKQKQFYAQGMIELDADLSRTANVSLEQRRKQTLLYAGTTVLVIVVMFLGWFVVFRMTRKWGTALANKNRLLYQQARELEDWNIVLDKKVSERTEQLAKSYRNLEAEIVDREKAEKDLQAANCFLSEATKKLEDSNRELQGFAYIASHDLREPLRKISSFGGLLKESLAGKLDHDQQENLEFMVDGADRMNQMIEGLLLYSRLNTKETPPEVVDLNEAVEQLTQLELAALLEETDATIEVPQPLPKVWAIPLQMNQLLQNLIVNGIKYRRQNIQPKIIITAKRITQDTLRIEIQDNGIGIKEEFHADIFAMFRRLHSRKKYDGTGIGLAVCKKIVEKHGGQIGVESKQGQGATFWFTLSLAQQTEKSAKQLQNMIQA